MRSSRPGLPAWPGGAQPQDTDVNGLRIGFMGRAMVFREFDILFPRFFTPKLTLFTAPWTGSIYRRIGAGSLVTDEDVRVWPWSHESARSASDLLGHKYSGIYRHSTLAIDHGFSIRRLLVG